MTEAAGEPIFRHGVASGDPLQDRVAIWSVRLGEPRLIAGAG